MSSADVTGHPLVRGEMHTGLAGLMHLRDDWARLIKRGATGGFAVTHSCYEALLRYRHPAPDRVSFFCLRGANGELQAICPLELTVRLIRRLPFRAWQFPEDPDRPCSAFVVAPGLPPGEVLSMLSPLLRGAAPGVGLALFERVEDGSPTWKAIRSSDPPCREFRRPPLFRLGTAEAAEAILAQASKKFRFNVRWGRRRMEKLAPLEHRVAAEFAELGPALDEFLALEVAGWKGTTDVGHAIRLRPAVERHARGLVELAGARGECEIHGLWQGDRCVAALVGLHGPGEMFVFKIARDEVFAPFSLGHLLVESVLDFCWQREGITAMNFGWEAEWMKPWGGQFVGLQDMYVSLGGLRGRLAMSLLNARSWNPRQAC